MTVDPPALTVCFDALGTCFNFGKATEALEAVMGDRLRAANSGANMVIMDWFHAAQRDFVYLSIISPPAPPIAQILKLTLPRSLAFALNMKPSLAESQMPDLTPVYETLSKLRPSPGLESGLKELKGLKTPAKVVLVTNGSENTTRGYLEQAGVDDLVDAVLSCDEVGKSKPFPDVYDGAIRVCNRLEVTAWTRSAGDGIQRWFVAAHLWDLHAARKHGFKTAYVLSEQPPVNRGASPDDTEAFFDLYGGKPDIVGSDLADVVRRIVQHADREVAAC